MSHTSAARFWFAIALAVFALGTARADQQSINLGLAPNSGTGDSARTAFGKVNSNFADLYTRLTREENAGSARDQSVQSLIGALPSKAPLASPTFTGVLTAPTISLSGTGSAGDISGMSVRATGGTAIRSLADRVKDAGISVLDYGTGGYVVGSGGDDSAAINAAITAASSGSGPKAGKVIFPYPSSGHYNVCAAPVTLPPYYTGVTLEGFASATPSIRLLPGCTSGITSILYRSQNTGALTQSRVNIDNLTFDGMCKTKYIADLQYSVATNITRTTFRNAAKGGSNFRLLLGYELYMDGTNRLENMNDDAANPCYASSADLPDYNLETYGSDSYFPGLIAINARVANFYNGDGGNNHFFGSHGWGYTSPINLVPQYNFIINGNADLTSCVADTWSVAGVLLNGYRTTGRSDAKVMGCSFLTGPDGAGKPAVRLADNLTYATVVYGKMPSSAGVTSGTAISPTNLIRGNDGSALNSSVVAAPVAGGDSANLTAYGAGGGAALSAFSTTPNAGLYLSAQGAAPVQANSNGVLAFSMYANPSAVNYLAATATAAGQGPQIQAAGSDANASLSLLGKGTAGTIVGAFVRTADPTTTDIPAGRCAAWNNTTAGTYKQVCNFGGTLRSSAMN